jgi:hypothetical protein
VGEHQPEVIEMKLAVGIGERDEVEPSGLEPRAQGSSVSLVDVMLQETNMGTMGRFRASDGSCVIAAAIIDNEDFVVSTKPSEGLVRFGDGLAKAGGFVKGGKDKRQARAIHGTTSGETEEKRVLGRSHKSRVGVKARTILFVNVEAVI